MYQVIRGGYETKHPNSFVRSCPVGIPNYLLLIIHTAGQFQIGKDITHITPGHALLISPNTPYRYGNPQGAYIDDWLHFSVSSTLDFSKVFPMTNQLFPVSDTKTLTQLIKQILWEASYTKPPYLKQNIDSFFTILINHLLASYGSKDMITTASLSYESQFQSLRLEMRNTLSEKHSIKDYAQMIGISESYFQHLYTDYFGISFQKDLIRLRIEEAQYLLSTTNLTMEEIADRCGYTSNVHFFRQFKSLTDITPNKHRKYGPPAFHTDIL